MLKTRVITAIALLAGLLAALFFLPKLAWAGFCGLICALAAWEWGGLAGWGGRARIVYGTVLGCLCLFLFDLREKSVELQLFRLAAYYVAAFFWLLVVPLWLRYKWRLRSWSAVPVGIIVLVPPSLFFFALRELLGPWGLLAACALVWVADIAAYFSGRAFGGKKLAPNISPGKTWAGAKGAVIGVLVYCNVGLWLVPDMFLSSVPNEFSVPLVLLFQFIFFVLAVWSIIGDLFESLLKRHAGVKDSSNLLPGHGGILDRIDSLTSTLPLMLVLLLPVYLLSGL